MKCKHVLIVEDNHDIREALESVIRDDGYSVYSVQNGKEALRALKMIPGRSLILLDMMMPVMNGWEFFEEVRVNNTIASLPIVVVSALGAASALATGDKKLSAIGYIKKPIVLDGLLETVQTHCEKSLLKDVA